MNQDINMGTRLKDQNKTEESFPVREYEVGRHDRVSDSYGGIFLQPR